MVYNKCCLIDISRAPRNPPIPIVSVRGLYHLRFTQWFHIFNHPGNWVAVSNDDSIEAAVVAVEPEASVLLWNESEWWGPLCDCSFRNTSLDDLINFLLFEALLAWASLLWSCADGCGVRRVPVDAMLCNGDFLQILFSHGLILLHHLHERRSPFRVLLMQLDLFGLVLFRPGGVLCRFAQWQVSFWSVDSPSLYGWVIPITPPS